MMTENQLKMQNYMRVCMLCKRGDRVFNICYRSGKYSAKDDIIEFFGVQVESFIFDDDVICNTCMNMLDNLANLKRRLYPIICKNSPNQQQFPYEMKPDTKATPNSLRFIKVWDTFLSNIRMSELSDYNNSTPSPCGFARSLSPNNLLRASYSVPYDLIPDDCTYSSLGGRFTPSILGHRSDTPFADKEIQNVFRRRTSKKGKRKGHNWTRRKTKRKLHPLSRSIGSRSSKASKTTTYTRCQSNLSDCSFQSLYRPQSRLSATSEYPNGLRYEGGRLLNKRTRSVSRAQDEIATRLATVEKLTNICWIKPCQGIEFYDLEMFTKHKVTEHKMLALFWCDECRIKYVSQEDLDKHNTFAHSVLLTYCPCCSKETFSIIELQKHLQEHLLHSVPCIYCDKFFLSKQLCENHVRDIHRGRKRRIRRVRSQSILDRVNKDVDSDDEISEVIYSPAVDKEFTVKVLVQNVHEPDSNSETCSSSEITESINSDMLNYTAYKQIPLKG